MLLVPDSDAQSLNQIKPISSAASFEADGSPSDEVAGSDNPADAALFARALNILEQIRPAVQDDGGDVELVAIRPDGTAEVRLHGACVGCPSSQMTLKMGIERSLRANIPEIIGVVEVS